MVDLLISISYIIIPYHLHVSIIPHRIPYSVPPLWKITVTLLNTRPQRNPETTQDNEFQIYKTISRAALDRPAKFQDENPIPALLTSSSSTIGVHGRKNKETNLIYDGIIYDVFKRT